MKNTKNTKIASENTHSVNSDYDYRKSRFSMMEKHWTVNRLNDLMVDYKPTDEELSNLRFAVMLYVSKALYFEFTTDEAEFMKRVDASRETRDNVTPNGGVVPKKKYQLEYNMVLRSWSKIIQSITKGRPELMTKFRYTPNIRIKFGLELEDNIERPLNTTYPHSDGWVEGPWSMNCYTPLFGDIENNSLVFWTPKSSETYSDKFLATAATYEEMQWVLDYYDFDENIVPKKGKVHISDFALIHATNREENCGTRISIDTTIIVGDHDVHEDRMSEYLNELEIVGEDIILSTGRSTKSDNVVNTKTTFSHYTTGHLKLHDCK